MGVKQGWPEAFCVRLLDRQHDRLGERDLALQLRIGRRAAYVDGEGPRIGVPGSGLLVVPGEGARIERHSDVAAFAGIENYASKSLQFLRGPRNLG